MIEMKSGESWRKINLLGNSNEIEVDLRQIYYLGWVRPEPQFEKVGRRPGEDSEWPIAKILL